MATLSLQRQKEIDAVIESVTLNTGLSYPENNLLDITNALGIKVVEMEMDSTINGAVQYKNSLGEVEPVIVLNQSYSPQRKTFTLAHELGHYLLHKNEESFRLDSFDYSGNGRESIKETEANYFAASLLVPKNKLIKVIQNTENVDAAVLADYFFVSKPVIANRLKWLRAN